MLGLWGDSFLLMALGMGTVFAFLTLLVIAMTIMSSIANRLVAEEIPVISPTAVSDQELAAVAAAAYRAAHNIK